MHDLPAQVERLAARGQQMGAGGLREHPAEQWRDGRQQMLAVVDDQQHPGAAQACDQQVVTWRVLTRVAKGKHARERAWHAVGVGGCEIDPPDTLRELVSQPGGGFDGEPRLAHAGRPDQGHQALLAHEPDQLHQLVVTADQARRMAGDAMQTTDLVVVERPLLQQDHAFQALQLFAGIQPERIGKDRVRLAIRCERLHLPARAIEGKHQVRPRALSLRYLRHPRP